MDGLIDRLVGWYLRLLHRHTHTANVSDPNGFKGRYRHAVHGDWGLLFAQLEHVLAYGEIMWNICVEVQVYTLYTYYNLQNLDFV